MNTSKEPPSRARRIGDFRHHGVFSPTHQRLARDTSLRRPKAVDPRPLPPYLGPECRSLRSQRRHRVDKVHLSSSMHGSFLARDLEINANLNVDLLGVDVLVDVDVSLGFHSSSTASSVFSSSSVSMASTSSAVPSPSSSFVSSSVLSSSSPSSSVAVPPSTSVAPSTSFSASSSASSSASPSASISTSSSASASASGSASSSASRSVSLSTSSSASVSVSASASSSVSASASSSVSASASSSSASASTSPSASSSSISTSVSASLSASGSVSASSSLSSQSSASFTSQPFSQASSSRSLSSSFAQTSSFTSLVSPSFSSTATTLSSPLSTSASDGGGHLAMGSSTTPLGSASATSSGGSLGTSPNSGSDFARNAGAIVGVSIGGVVALIGGVLLVFFGCRRLKARRLRLGGSAASISGPMIPPVMRARPRRSGAWRSPLEDDDLESVAGASVVHTALQGQGLGFVGGSSEQGEGSAEGSGGSDSHATSIGHSLSHGHGHMPFAQAGATLQQGIESAAWYAAGAAMAGGLSSNDHSSSSQSHSQSHSGFGGLTGSSLSHGHSSSTPPSSVPPMTPPELMQSSSSGHGVIWRPGVTLQQTPPSSYSMRRPDEGSAPKSPGFFGRLRRASGSASSSAAARPFDPGKIQDPSAPSQTGGRLPSSLLNPPLPPLPPAPPQTWRPQPRPLQLLAEGESPPGSEDVLAPEGLLRPGLAVLLPPSHSTRTLGDHVDYSRPIGGRVNLRMESMQTVDTLMSSEDDNYHDDPASSHAPLVS